MECMGKLEKPIVEAFVMSHCPFGTQIEKGMLPVVSVATVSSVLRGLLP